MSILSSLHSAAGALQAFDRVLEVTQYNVANVSTAGFVKQRQILASRPFDLDRGSQGGVLALGIQSSRDEYAEQAVRRQTAGWRHHKVGATAQADVGQRRCERADRGRVHSHGYIA